ncbi:hypothetical protein BDAP_001588 [Binucleata daphniae]
MLLKPCKNNKINKAWRCFTGGCSNHMSTISLFIGSFFYKRKLDVRNILQIIHYLSQNTLIVDIEKFTKIKYEKITNIKNQVQIKINDYWINKPTKLGGPGCNVQVDETKSITMSNPIEV